MKGLQNELIKFLMLEDEVTLNDIMNKFDSPESEIIKTINEINFSFKKDKIISTDQGIYMSESSKMKCYQSFIKGNDKIFSHLEVEERHHLIIIELLVTDEYFSLQRLAEICLVSKNTILNDLKEVREILAQKGLYLNYTRKQGYFIFGSEFVIRNLLVTTTKKILNSLSGKILLAEKELVAEEDIFFLRKRLEQVERNIGIRLTDEQLDELPYILQILLKRARKFKQKWSFRVEKFDIKNTVEYPKIKKMFWDQDYLSETDMLYLSLQVLASNMVESALQIADGDEISIAADKFIDNIQGLLAIHILRRTELKKKVILHMGPAIYRNLLGFQINNPLADEFIQEYEDIYNIVLNSVAPFEDIIHHNLSKEEVVYLSMIVLSWIYQTEEEEAETVFKAAVLCQSGTSISKLLLTTLQSMFPDIDFLGAYSVRQFEQNQEEVDFIFSTVPVESSAKTFIIPSILDKQTRIELKNQVSQEMTDNSQKMAQKLIASIMDYIPEENMEIVSDKICHFFKNNHSETKNNIDVQQEETAFFFSIDNIDIVDERIDWMDLVNYSMAPLLKRNSITKEYIEQTNLIFYQNYEQMLIAPDVYLPHVHPKYGVNKMDFQILIFKEPIKTPTGGEVKIVVALAPSEDNRHVSTLIKLNNLFLDQKILSLITKGENKFSIKQILNA